MSREDEIDEIAVRLKEMLAYQNCFHGYADVDTLSTALKSALSDSERIDWINENCVLYIPGAEPDGHDQVCWNEDQGRTLREAIDERRGK